MAIFSPILRGKSRKINNRGKRGSQRQAKEKDIEVSNNREEKERKSIGKRRKGALPVRKEKGDIKIPHLFPQEQVSGKGKSSSSGV